MKQALTALVLSSALASSLMAQGPGPGPRGPGNRLKFPTAQLGLTAEQQSQAATIFSNAHASESTLRASMKTAHQGLNDAVKSNNTIGIEQLSTTIGNLAGELTLAQAKTRAAFYQILTSAQRAKLDQLESQRPAWFRGARQDSRAGAQ